MREIVKVERGIIYHLYNRGTNGENIFVQERNYTYFLNLWRAKMSAVADLYAWALLKNHFHLLVHIKPEEVIAKDAKTGKQRVLEPSTQLSNFFNAYAQSINKAMGRTGSLFEHPFKRIAVDDDGYLRQLVAYIHFNPQRHGFVDDFREYPYISYHSFKSDDDTFIKRNAVLDWFGGKERFLKFHDTYREFLSIEKQIDEAG